MIHHKKYRVPQQTIAAAARCRHDNSCLETGRCGTGALCAVAEADGDSILYLDSAAPLQCPYQLKFGGKQVCTCPVHYDLFGRHQV